MSPLIQKSTTCMCKVENRIKTFIKLIQHSPLSVLFIVCTKVIHQIKTHNGKKTVHGTLQRWDFSLIAMI